MEQIAPISILRTHTATSMFSSIVEFVELGLYFIYFYPLTKFASAHPFCSFQSSLIFFICLEGVLYSWAIDCIPKENKGQ